MIVVHKNRKLSILPMIPPAPCLYQEGGRFTEIAGVSSFSTLTFYLTLSVTYDMFLYRRNRIAGMEEAIKTIAGGYVLHSAGVTSTSLHLLPLTDLAAPFSSSACPRPSAWIRSSLLHHILEPIVKCATSTFLFYRCSTIYLVSTSTHSSCSLVTVSSTDRVLERYRFHINGIGYAGIKRKGNTYSPAGFCRPHRLPVHPSRVR
ncbi:hypothetical protein BJV74DRAFT_188929 [Russula compacta]|nr:hypothetical protein BJV74DRAFT_188929 [Russula compacta]